MNGFYGSPSWMLGYQYRYMNTGEPAGIMAMLKLWIARCLFTPLYFLDYFCSSANGQRLTDLLAGVIVVKTNDPLIQKLDEHLDQKRKQKPKPTNGGVLLGVALVVMLFVMLGHNADKA